MINENDESYVFHEEYEDEKIEDDPKEWISKCRDILTKEGYSIEENKILSEKVKWRPRLFATKVEDRIAIDVRVINELDEVYLEGLKTAVKLFQDIGVFLAFPGKMLIESDVIKEANKRKVGILRIFDNKLEVLLEAGKALSTEKLEKKEIVTKKHLSLELLKVTKSINKLEYAQDLKVFIGLYENADFASLDEEYTLVINFITTLLKEKYGKRIVAEGLINLKELEPFLKKGGAYYREHFLHSFQVFLLGSYIIDQNYNTFNDWYRRAFPTQDPISIDFPWLLTSIFHDVGYPMQKLDNINERVVDQFFSRRPSHININFEDVLREEFFSRAISELTNLQRHMRADEIQETWVYNPKRENGNGFGKVLLRHLNKRNHGTLSALILLKKVSLEELFKSKEYKEGSYSNAVFPAALAIALHDTPLWEDLDICGEIPIKIEKNPLCALLIFCDAVQEWGRPGTDCTISVFDLKKIELKGNTAHITLICDDFGIAINRKIEYENVKSVLNSDAFHFEIEVETGYQCG